MSIVCGDYNGIGEQFFEQSDQHFLIDGIVLQQCYKSFISYVDHRTSTTKTTGAVRLKLDLLDICAGVVDSVGAVISTSPLVTVSV